MAAAVKESSLLDTLKTVLAGFVGVRRRAAHDEARIRPLHLAIAAILFVVLFVAAIRTIVGFVVSP